MGYLFLTASNSNCFKNIIEMIFSLYVEQCTCHSNRYLSIFRGIPFGSIAIADFRLPQIQRYGATTKRLINPKVMSHFYLFLNTSIYQYFSEQKSPWIPGRWLKRTPPPSLSSPSNHLHLYSPIYGAKDLTWFHRMSNISPGFYCRYLITWNSKILHRLKRLNAIRIYLFSFSLESNDNKIAAHNSGHWK